jgi:protocatechuate 3,4-dioxygenase, beta subunit
MRIVFKLSCILLTALLVCCTGKTNHNEPIQVGDDTIVIGGGCDGCELMYQGMPENLSDADTSKGWNERGQKLVVEGTVFKPGGKNFAPDTVIYYWHTDNDGLYSKTADEETVHGHLRGWLKTGLNGKFKIYTIRPASYPNSKIPAHIHFSIREPDIRNEYYIDDILFDDDKLLTEPERAKQEERGGNGIVKPKTVNDVQFVKRDIILGLNIPNYPD